MIGVTRSDGVVDVAMLEHAIRDDLDKNAARAMVVLRPLKVVLSNYPEGQFETLKAAGHPQRDDLGERTLPFGKVVYIDAEDFREEANKKYKRLVLGKRVRLRHAYVIEADKVIKNEAGEVVEVHARYLPETLGEDPADGVKPKGVIHWAAAHDCADLVVRLYDRLFADPEPGAGDKDFLQAINPNSLLILDHCKGEPGLRDAVPEQNFQFEREGYFCRDMKEEGLVFNRTIDLKDSWTKTDTE